MNRSIDVIFNSNFKIGFMLHCNFQWNSTPQRCSQPFNWKLNQSLSHTLTFTLSSTNSFNDAFRISTNFFRLFVSPFCILYFIFKFNQWHMIIICIYAKTKHSHPYEIRCNFIQMWIMCSDLETKGKTEKDSNINNAQR